MKVSAELPPSLSPSDLSSAEEETESSSPQQHGSPTTHKTYCLFTDCCLYAWDCTKQPFCRMLADVLLTAMVLRQSNANQATNLEQLHQDF